MSERCPTRWSRISQGYYLCEIWGADNLRNKVYLQDTGQITTFLSWEKPKDADMLSQVMEEAKTEMREPVAVSRPATRRIGRPVEAKFAGTCIRSGQRYEIGAPIEYIEPLGWALVGTEMAARIDVSTMSPDDIPF